MSNLFTAVSVEQQEIVSGGVVVVPTIFAARDLQFTQNLALLRSGTEVTGTGARSANDFQFANINSRAIENVNLDYRIV
jgi:hypothetical protein